MTILVFACCRESTMTAGDVSGSWARRGDSLPPISLTLSDSGAVLSARLRLSGIDARGTATLEGNTLRVILPGRPEVHGEFISRDELQLLRGVGDVSYTLVRTR